MEMLNHFINKNVLTFADLSSHQTVTYTYKGMNNRSSIDYVLFDPNNKNIIESNQNKSDNNPIFINYLLTKSKAYKKSEKLENTPKFSINWNNILERLAYQEKVDSGIKKHESLAEDLAKETLKEKLKLFLNQISSVLINSTIKTKNEFKHKKQKKKRIGDLK